MFVARQEHADDSARDFVEPVPRARRENETRTEHRVAQVFEACNRDACPTTGLRSGLHRI